MSDSTIWGLHEGKIAREVGGQAEEVPALEILRALQERKTAPPEKSLTDRAYELLFVWIGTNVRPVTVQNDTEELAREAVRWCRALESEVEQETKRQEQKPRAARRPVDDEEEWP